MICLWCEAEFQVRATGGSGQRFCLKDCRRDFHTACRIWAVREFEAGRVSVKDLKGASTQRARCYKGGTAPFCPSDGLTHQPGQERASTVLVGAHSVEAA